MNITNSGQHPVLLRPKASSDAGQIVILPGDTATLTDAETQQYSIESDAVTRLRFGFTADALEVWDS